MVAVLLARHRCGLAFQRDDGNLVLGFDVPTDIGGVTYMPSDLVELTSIGPECFDWTFVARFFDSLAAGLPRFLRWPGRRSVGSAVGTRTARPTRPTCAS